ncbi:hypothetical protein F5X68DRAFT_65939 [Plectosphaerella plurivora]|uniref:Uncharacterized protein n=1 Tax=Plectosphaerella plurivora TaxID=936078 RepID=A0A9P9ACW8_9PEZI|nr:hypothetical protein F5X68DRAFT_65939 [Plectosphaerella plurivora]
MVDGHPITHRTRTTIIPFPQGGSTKHWPGGRETRKIKLDLAMARTRTAFFLIPLDPRVTPSFLRPWHHLVSDKKPASPDGLLCSARCRGRPSTSPSFFATHVLPRRWRKPPSGQTRRSNDLESIDPRVLQAAPVSPSLGAPAVAQGPHHRATGRQARPTPSLRPSLSASKLVYLARGRTLLITHYPGCRTFSFLSLLCRRPNSPPPVRHTAA